MASVTFKRGTRAEIEATAKQDGQILIETDQNKKNKMYIDLPDGSRVLIGNSGEAIDTSYDNATSGLDATNVQSAIDELSAKIGQENISQVGNSVTGAINNLNSNLVDVCTQINNSQSLNPGNTHNLVLEANCAYLIFIGKYDTSTTSKYDGTNISTYVATTTSVRTFAYPIVNNSGVSVSLTNLLMSINIPSDGYVRRLYVVKIK